MANSQQKTKRLIDKYLAGNATPEEVKKLERAYHQAAARMNPATEETPEEIDKVGMESWMALMRRIEQKPVREIALWQRIAAAASILLFLSFGGYFLLHKPIKNQVATLKPGTFKNDVLPSRNNAYITLGNGAHIVVNAASTGNLARQGNTNIQKTNNGQVVYQSSTSPDIETVYNTFVVPRGGGKRELRLADGTLAVLDAGSSIRFPVAFNGKDRRVSVTGQVYFEVVHNIKMPFFVTAKGQTVEDIGTHFNVNAFEDEPTVKTTLLEGSIKIGENILKPGQQAVTANNGTLTIENTVDLQQVIAWKNDKFEFNKNSSLQAMMRQLARWYDLDVTYQGTNKQYHIAGDMPRDAKLSEVLKILEYNGLQFSIEGKKLTVYQ